MPKCALISYETIYHWVWDEKEGVVVGEKKSIDKENRKKQDRSDNIKQYNIKEIARDRREET